jgi:hypothetical protein
MGDRLADCAATPAAVAHFGGAGARAGRARRAGVFDMTPAIGSRLDSNDTGRLSWIVPPIAVPAALGAMILIYALVRAYV